SADKCMENLIYYFRDLLLLKLVPDRQAGTERIVDAERFKGMADAFSKERLFQMIDTLNRYQIEMRHASQPQTLFEVALMKICTMPESGSSAAATQHAGAASAQAGGRGDAASPDVQKMQQRIDALERRLEQLLRDGVPAGSAAAGGGGAAGGGPGRAGGGARNAGGFVTRSGGSSVAL